MKVRISYTVEVSDHRRREINNWYGRPGLADRAAVKRWYQSVGLSMDDDLDNVPDANDWEDDQ